MDKSLLRFQSQGDSSLLVWRIPPTLAFEQEEIQAFVLPFMPRAGGGLYAIPDYVLSAEAVMEGLVHEDLLGPSKEFAAKLIVEDDMGNVSDLDATTNFVVIDLDDRVLQQMREYDPVTDSTEPILPFSAGHVAALPKLSDIGDEVAQWISAVAHERLNFYSAREEPESAGPVTSAKKAVPKKTPKVSTAALAERVDALASQLQALMSIQTQAALTAAQPTMQSAGVATVPGHGAMVAKVPPLSSTMQCGTTPKDARHLLGPPPKAKAFQELSAVDADPGQGLTLQGSLQPGSGDHMASVLVQQSAALSQLVAHLAGGDPMVDLAGSSSSSGLSLNTKGAARRERMQSELANRTSNYFQQVLGQIFRRLNPSKPVPRTPEEIAASGCSMTAYLEKHGGYKNAKDVGMAQWIVAHAFDAGAQEDVHAMKEYIAILAACLEQSAMDGNWQLAYILSLMEDPPQTVFTDRMGQLTVTGRPFSPLVPPQWAAVALAYVKEMDVLTTRKTEIKKNPSAQPKSEPDSQNSPSPKRKPRFPKKPKGGGSEGSP